MIIHDVGIQFTSVEFIQNAKAIGSSIKYILVEVYYSISIVEQYYVPLRRVYEIITKELLQVTKQYVLQIVVKATNNTTRLDSLVLTLLVFGIFLQININNILSTTTIKRGKVIRKTIKEVTKLYTKRYVTEALWTYNRLNITEILGLVISKEVLVQRENKGQDSLYIILSIDSYDYTIKLSSRLMIF